MKTRKFNLNEWTAKLYAFIEGIFDEEDEVDEGVDERDETQHEELKQTDPQADHDYGSSNSEGWNLLTFLDLVQSIILILPLLGYTSSHWTIYHVQNTRELHQHIIGTAAFLLMGLFLLFLVFPKIMRVLLLATTLTLAILPMLSKQHNYANLWEKYFSQVKSIPVHLENEIQGHLFYTDEISDKLRGLVIENIDHKNIRSYLKENISYCSGPENGSFGVPECMAAIELFRKVNAEWKYKSDPSKGDLFRSPHRTIRSFSGDCDDYTVLIATLFISHGYEMRIIMTKGHVYPEMAVPDELTFKNLMEPLIRGGINYLAEGSTQLCYHKDNEGRIWLNLDYTASYPGGPFMHEQVLKVIYLN